jgi:nucleoid DNA-binding protein
MKKRELCREVAARMGIPIKQAEKMVRALNEVIVEAIIEGETVVLDIGVFKTKEIKERVGYDLVKKETVVRPSRKVPIFSASKKFKEAIREIPSSV